MDLCSEFPINAIVASDAEFFTQYGFDAADEAAGLEKITPRDYELQARDCNWDRLTADQYCRDNIPMERRALFWAGSKWDRPAKKAKGAKRPAVRSEAPPVAASPSKPLQPQPPPAAAQPPVFEQIKLVPDTVAMRALLEWLAAPVAGSRYADGLIEITRDNFGDQDPRFSRLYGLKGIEAAVSYAAMMNQQGHNIYVGVTLKKPDTPRNHRANATHFYVGVAIPVDIDEDAEQVNAKLAAIASAGAITTTGTKPELRQQKWHRLTTPCDDIDRFGKAFKRIVRHVGGDTSAVNSAQLMRLAGSISYPKPDKVLRGYVKELTRLVIDPDAACVEIERFAELPEPKLPKPERFAEPAASPPAKTFFEEVNTLALADLDAWFPEIFGDDARPQKRGGYRVSSEALGRDLEEDLSAHPTGIKDFGVHDMGDPKEGNRTPIDIVIDYKKIASPKDAALWLCERLRIDARTIGFMGIPVGVADKPTSVWSEDDVFDPWERYPVPPFPFEVLPKALRDHVEIVSVSIGCDPSALAMADLTALSGAITHELKLKMNRNDEIFKLSVCLWTLLVGDPSTWKTPIINAAIAPLVEIQKELWRKYLKDLKEWEESKDEGKEPEPLEPLSYLIKDTTPEALCQMLSRSPRGTMTVADELAGWLGKMEKYGGGSSANRALWLQARNGGGYQVNRITRKTAYIENLSSSLLGGIQPERLAEIIGLASDGLLQRFLPIMVGRGKLGKDIDTGAALA